MSSYFLCFSTDKTTTFWRGVEGGVQFRFTMDSNVNPSSDTRDHKDHKILNLENSIIDPPNTRSPFMYV